MWCFVTGLKFSKMQSNFNGKETLTLLPGGSGRKYMGPILDWLQSVLIFPIQFWFCDIKIIMVQTSSQYQAGLRTGSAFSIRHNAQKT